MAATKTYNYLYLFLGLSAVLHGVILYYYPIAPTVSLDKSHVGNTSILQVVVTRHDKRAAQPHPSTPARKTSDNAASSTKSNDTPQVATSTEHQPGSTSATSQVAPALPQKSGTDHHQLLSLLHSAVDQNKSYPIGALRLHKQGTARVGFALYPDGRIDNVKIDVSSGNQSLDTSALQAVENISPFYPAREYLNVVEYFYINITFQL